MNMNMNISLEMMQFYVVIIKVSDQDFVVFFYHSMATSDS
jgi:hypothetical protein